MNTANSILREINNSQLYHYKKEGTISSVNGTTTMSFKTDNLPMWCFLPYITLTNANGSPLDVSLLNQNLILVNIKVIRGENLFGDQPFTLQSFNELFLSEQFSGFYVEGNTVYEISFTMQNIPSTAINMPYSVSLNFVGYQLGYGSTITWNDARRKLDFRYSQNRQYSLDTKTSLSTSSGVQNTFRTTWNGQLIDTMRIDVMDANGKIIKEVDYQDEFVMSLRYNTNLILLNDLPIRVFNKIFLSKRFKKFFMLPNTDYSIYVSGTGNANITAQRLDFDALTEQFVIGDTVTGAGGATGVIESIVYSGATGYMILNSITGAFVDNELITGAVEGSASVNGTLYGSINAYPLTFNVKFDGYQMRENTNE